MTDWPSIVREHGPMTFETAWRLVGNAVDAEDVVQEVFLEAYQRHAREPIDNWGGFLRRLATRRAIDRLRRRRPAESLVPEQIAASGAAPESHLLELELAERLRRAVAELPEREATVFSLHYFGELDHASIARELDVTVGAVGVALHKARAKLKINLGYE